MTSGGAARKSLDHRESALAAMRATVADFNKHSLTWEREVENLLDEVESLAIHAALDARSERTSNCSEGDDQLVQVASHQQQLARKQEAAAAELYALRHLVEQQTELLTAFISFAAPPNQADKSHIPLHEPVVDAVQAQFEQLQKQVTAAKQF